MKFLFLLISIVMLIFAAGCDTGGDDDDNVLPTVMELPTDEVQSATEGPSAVLTETETSAPTDTLEPTLTSTPQPTNTPVPTIMSSATPSLNPTRVVELSATAAILEAPRLSTLTPVPIGADVQPPVYTIPVLAADVVITEQQFQEEVSLRVAANPKIQSAGIDFVTGNPSGILVRLTATGGQAFVTGDVFVSFQLSGGLLAISILDISVGSGEPPQSFVDIVQNDLFQLIVDSFDAIITQRLGTDHDLEQITFTDTTMDIMLLVPEQ